jgi:hypothetical protein
MQPFLCGTTLAALALALSSPIAAQDEDGEEQQPRLPFEPRAVEILFTDGSNLRLHLADEPLELVTPHGKLKIPAEDVLRIEFAQRLSKEAQQQIDELMTQLRSEDEAMRAVAAEGLLLFGEKAWPALAKAAKSGEPAIATYAAEVLAQLRVELGNEATPARDDDVIQTPDTKIAGRIMNPTIKLETAQFGELAMNLADARSLRHQSYIPAEKEPTSEETLPDPGNLKAYEQRIDQTFSFMVTAATGGSVWGTDIYTTDTRLSTAAIHSGVLKEGETGVVRVKILPGQPSYPGSSRNGITSSTYGNYGGSYEIIQAGGVRGGGARMRIMRGPRLMRPK